MDGNHYLLPASEIKICLALMNIILVLSYSQMILILIHRALSILVYKMPEFSHKTFEVSQVGHLLSRIMLLSMK